jgi:hypothetical protein
MLFTHTGVAENNMENNEMKITYKSGGKAVALGLVTPYVYREVF